jgi:hypothetical protein
MSLIVVVLSRDMAITEFSQLVDHKQWDSNRHLPMSSTMNELYVSKCGTGAENVINST